MKLTMLAAACGCLMLLAGCGAAEPKVEGKWCLTGTQEALTLKGGVATKNAASETGTYTVKGKEVTIDPPEGQGPTMAFTLDGTTMKPVAGSLAASMQPPIELKKCD